MNILVVGSGAREHALCLAFRRSPKATRIFCAPGNAGIAAVAECVAIDPGDVAGLANFAAGNAVGLTFVGGEVPLAMGVVDEFTRRGLAIIGPTQSAARLESSKSFAKDIMARNGVPTAKYVSAHSPDFALLELESGDFGGDDSPVVIKADGLAAGKGVVVAANRKEAERAINEMTANVGTAAAEKIVLEECLKGREVSVMLFAAGESYILMPAVRDHKRIGDGDTGANTGGMGTVTSPDLLTDDELADIKENVIHPTLRAIEREGLAFRGVLFIGLMMTDEGAKVLEYNVRLGDPEAEAVLVRLETDLVDICEAMLADRLSEIDVAWKPGASACIILAAENYPAKPRTGDAIAGLAEAAAEPNVVIFHGGTAVGEKAFVTASGRVLAVTATGTDLNSALASAYASAQKISWPGMQYRRDIGKSV